MKQKTSFTSFIFIFIAAFIFAGFFTIVGVLAWRLMKSSAPAVPAQTQSAAKATPSAAQPEAAPQQVPSRVQKPAPAARATSAKAYFERGLKQCLARNEFPCSWRETRNGVNTYYSISKPDGFVLRNIHSMDDRPLSQTAVSQTGEVLLYRENNTTWFFDKSGRVRHIMVGAVPRAGEDDPHHSYFYDVNGQLNSCVCADKTRTCCTDAPQLEPNRTHYCEMFPLDQEFCAK